MPNPQGSVTVESKPPCNYSLVLKSLFSEKRLSIRSRLILLYLSGQDPKWEIRFEHLEEMGFGKEGALRDAFKEMLDLGYVRLVSMRDPITKEWKGKRYFVSLKDSEGKRTSRFSHPAPFAPCENRDVKNSSYSFNNIKNRPKDGRVRLFEEDFGVEEKECSSVAQQLTLIFAKWTVRNRLHVGKNGSTKTGWTPRTIKNWTRSCQDLLDTLDQNVTKVKDVMKWYFDHWQEEYIPQCHSMRSFSTKFVSLELAIRRSKNQRKFRNGQSEEEEDIGYGQGPTKEQLRNMGMK